MKKLKDTPFYEKPLHILSYDFGDFYLYDDYIVGEIAEDVIVTWEEQGEFINRELKSIYNEKYDELKYISNRIHKYSIVLSDWLKFSKCDYNFTGYGIVCYSKRAYLNALLEKVFVPTKLKTFTSLEEAIAWAKRKDTISINDTNSKISDTTSYINNEVA